MLEDANRSEYFNVIVTFYYGFQVDDELEIKAYYAGHVIGAAMFHCKVGQHSFVYTGTHNIL